MELKVQVQHDFKWKDKTWNINIGGYKFLISDIEFISYGFKEVNLLSIPHGPVSFRIFEKSLFDKHHVANKFDLEENVIYYVISFGDYYWTFKNFSYAYELFSLLLQPLYNEVKNKIEGEVNDI